MEYLAVVPGVDFLVTSDSMELEKKLTQWVDDGVELILVCEGKVYFLRKDGVEHGN